MFWDDFKYDTEIIKEIHYQKYIIEMEILIIPGHCKNIGGNFNNWSIFPYCSFLFAVSRGF